MLLQACSKAEEDSGGMGREGGFLRGMGVLSFAARSQAAHTHAKRTGRAAAPCVGLGCAAGRIARESLVLDDGGKRVGLEAGAADQGAVNLFLSDEAGGVVGLDAAAVENADGHGDIRA